MNERELIESLSDKLDINKTDIGRVIHGFIDVIKEEIYNNNNIKIRNFGTFFVKILKASSYINPKTKEKIIKSERKAFKFKPSKEIFIELNKK